MKILIAGGGPGGLTLAATLLKHGHTVMLVEKSAVNRAAGYSIGLHLNGWGVMERLGLIGDFRARAMPLGLAQYLDTRGRKLFSYDYRVLAGIAGGRMLAIMRHHAPSCAIMRQDVQDILLHAVQDRADIRFGTTISSVEDDGYGVNVTFSGGDQDRFDIVVGADGYRSSLREQVFGPHEAFLRPLGYRAAAFRLKPAKPLTTSFMGMMDVDLQGGLYNAGDGTTATLFCWRDDGCERVAAPDRLPLLKRHFGHWPEPVASTLDADVDWEQSFFDSVIQVDMPCWSKGRVVLLGDSAWCLTFLSGQGTSTAMAGAWVLAQELTRLQVSEAFEAYEQRMRPLTTRMQAISRNIGGQYVPKSRFGIRMQSWLLPVLLSKPFAGWTSARLSAPELDLG